ncbi:hypothetical protein C8F04DRAFT_1242014 [Mycena alexandri]|uniref:Uncharacterized protein n=1 Tax=Mycena alexandri TaxID=1745969 RepID=A0AAD6WPG1_9AGAR|nr:hypothetical protein C8F04DRAFT_1242014 [Mycena alexandri]
MRKAIEHPDISGMRAGGGVQRFGVVDRADGRGASSPGRGVQKRLWRSRKASGRLEFSAYVRVISYDDGVPLIRRIEGQGVGASGAGGGVQKRELQEYMWAISLDKREPSVPVSRAQGRGCKQEGPGEGAGKFEPKGRIQGLKRREKGLRVVQESLIQRRVARGKGKGGNGSGSKREGDANKYKQRSPTLI